MPIETNLTRTLDIRFIDARAIANEAKLNLGIFGYPSQDEEAMLLQEAIRIFEEHPAQMKRDMRRLRDHLDACKQSSQTFSSEDFSSSETSEELTRRSNGSLLDMFSRMRR